MRIFLLIVLITSILLNTSPALAKDLGPISVDIISSEAHSIVGAMSVKVKIINNSGKKINNCFLTCILMDDKKKEIGFDTSYVIQRGEGGLNSNDYNYCEIMIFIDKPERVKYIAFKIKSIDF